MTKRLNQLQNVDEIHIEFDILSNTEEGCAQLRERMMKILTRIQVEERRYKELQAEYLSIKKYIEIAHKMKKELEEAKHAGQLEVKAYKKYYRNCIMRDR